MKRFLPLCASLFVILSALSLQTVNSQPLLVENFDYPDGTLLTDVGWTAHSGEGTNSVDVALPGLYFFGYPLAGIGGAARVDNNGEDVNKTFTTQTSGTVYVAFMVDVFNVATGYFLHLGLNPFNTSNFFGKVFMQESNGDWYFGVSKTASSSPALSPAPIGIGSIYFLVLKYEIVDGSSNDNVSLYIFNGEIPATEPSSPTIVASDGTASDYSPGAIALRQFNSSQNVQVDGIRIGKTWSEAVTDIPSADITAPVFSAGYPKVENIDATQADLAVSLDEAGTAYYVVVPDGSTAPTVEEVVAGTDYGTVTLTSHGTIGVIAGGTPYSETITGLTDKTDYDIYVVAEDDEDTPNRQAETVMVDLYTIRPPDVIFSADFETSGSLLPFTQVSVTGDQVWVQDDNAGNGFAYMNGYSGGSQENEDWLISPLINLAASEMNVLNFMTAKNYTGPDLQVMISTDFNGNYNASDIAAATWTDITAQFSYSGGSYAWVASGDFSLDAYTEGIYVAFKYVSTATTNGAAGWEVDDFKVTGYLLPGSDATLSDLLVDGTTIDSFDPGTLTYEYVLEASVTTPPAVTCSTSDDGATAVVTDATDLTGDATARTTTVEVTAVDGVTKLTYSIKFNPIIAVADMAALRAVPSSGWDRIYQVTGEVVVSGLNPSQRNQKYVQDATAGVLIDDASGTITTAFSEGDGISGLTGTLNEYSNLLEFVPYRDPGAASSTGNILSAQVVTVADFIANQESYESELVNIVGVAFADADGTATFQEKHSYNISVGTDVTILRTIFLGTDLTGKVIPYMADVTGIATVFSTDAQLAPRSFSDFNIYSSVATLSDLQVSGTTVPSFASGTLTYNVSLAAGTVTVPTVTATATEANATVVITPATSLSGDEAARTTKIDVTSHDQSAESHYTIVFTVLTGIEDNLSGRHMIYPVPAKSEITISGTMDVSLIEIFDITGNVLVTESCNSEAIKKINIDQLAHGVYFIRLTTSNGALISRFIKE
jgi:hypothetical protein